LNILPEKHKNNALLLVLAKTLSTQSWVEKEELEDLIKKHAVSPLSQMEESSFYRDKLNAQLATSQVLREINQNHHIHMNKDRE